MYAKQYQLRERGLHQVHEILSTSEVHSRKELSTMVKATVQILKKGLNDKVLSVSSMGGVGENYLSVIFFTLSLSSLSFLIFCADIFWQH